MLWRRLTENLLAGACVSGEDALIKQRCIVLYIYEHAKSGVEIFFCFIFWFYEIYWKLWKQSNALFDDGELFTPSNLKEVEGNEKLKFLFLY